MKASIRKALRWGCLLAAVGSLIHSGSALAVLSEEDGGEEDPFYKAPWKEAEIALPAYPKDSNLIEFYVAAVATNHFYIDSSSLSTSDQDGVIRYVLVVRTAGGATNVTYEGIRCETTEYKVYAMGRADGTWARSRLNEWRPVKNELVNRHRAALVMDYLCVVSAPRTAKEALRALKHPPTLDAPVDRLFN